MTTNPPTKSPARALQAMQKPEFAKMMRELKDHHDAADEAAMSVASAYKKVKKRGINLDAIKLVRRLMTLDNPAKVQAFLADFDRGRELAGFDDQQQLFEEDKTKPQKQADLKIVEIKTGKPKTEETAAPPKSTRVARSKKNDAAPVAEVPAAPEPSPVPAIPSVAPVAKAPSRKALFDEGDEDIKEIGEVEKARQAGLAAGLSDQDYDNPYSEKGEFRDAWHKGWIEGSESLMDEDDKASA